MEMQRAKVVMIDQDATRRRNGVRALTKHRTGAKPAWRTFEAIVRNAPDAIVCVSGEGRILEFNAQAERLWGRSRAAAIGADFLETCFCQQERFRVNCEMQFLGPGEAARDLRSFVALADGREAALSWDFSFASAENGTSAFYVAVAHELRGADCQAPEADIPGSIVFKADFNDTVDLVLNSLCAIMERIDCIHARTTPEVVDRLRNSYDEAENGRRIPPKTAAAVERLVLGLITERKRVS